MTDHRVELRRIADGFAAALADVRGAPGTAGSDRGLRPDNLSLMMPFYLIEAEPFDGDVDAARVMALGNAFGATHFLLQDRELDGDERPSPGGCHLSDRCLVLFARQYGRLFSGGRFWSFLDRYLGEYFASLSWEREVLGTRAGAAAVSEDELPSTLTRLGHKISPLKACACAVSMLAGREDRLPLMERVIERFHTAYQLADDLEDLADDLEANRWSVVSWILARSAGLDEPPAGRAVDRLLSGGLAAGALPAIIDTIDENYASAIEDAERLGAPSLRSHLERCRRRTAAIHHWMSRRLSIVLRSMEGAGGTEGPRAENTGSLRADAPARLLRRVHAFEVRGQAYVLDIDSGLFFEADRLAFDVIEWLRRGAGQAELDVLRMNSGQEPVGEAIREVWGLVDPGAPTLPAGDESGGLPLWDDVPGDVLPPGIAALALNLSDGCNLRCDYCYLGGNAEASPQATPAAPPGTAPAANGGVAPVLMSEETALRAVDLLIDESLGESRLSIVFFGGEPLLNPSLIESVVGHARNRVRADGRAVTFHMTTNGTLLTPRMSERLHSLGVGILVSIDGAACDHDAHRVFPGGGGSYSTIVANLLGLPEGMRVGARATVTEESRPLSVIVEHLRGLGFSVVHLAPVSGPPMSAEFSSRLCDEFEELARRELEAVRDGRPPSVGNLVEPVLALRTGARRPAPCGAGARYVAAGADGTLSFCHRFAGDARFVVGDVGGGLDRDAVRRLLGRLPAEAAACRECWARHLCGGPCLYDLTYSPEDTVGNDAPRCRLRRRIFELAMWIYASLPGDGRARLAGIARRDVRPEIGAGKEPGS